MTARRFTQNVNFLFFVISITKEKITERRYSPIETIFACVGVVHVFNDLKLNLYNRFKYTDIMRQKQLNMAFKILFDPFLWDIRDFSTNILKGFDYS